jgi:hypothetical protein
MEISEFDYQLFDINWFNESKPFIQKCFDSSKSGFSYLTNSKSKQKVVPSNFDDVNRKNIIMKNTRYFQNYKDNEVSEYEDIFLGFPKKEHLDKKFQQIENFVSKNIISCKTTYITFSTNISGATKGIENLHPLLNFNRCNVWAFSIPLFFNNESPQSHSFNYSYQSFLFKPRYYIDSSNLINDNIKYSCIEIPKDGKLFSIQFDGSRTPYYFDYTAHLYAWFIFNGVEYKPGCQINAQFQIDLL